MNQVRLRTGAHCAILAAMVRIFTYVIERFSWAILLMMAISSARADTWDEANDPAQFDLSRDFRYGLHDVPLKASLKQIPWSETYWPSFRGSINLRWNQPKPDGFTYTPYPKAQLGSLSLDTLKTLSPAEKYDLLMGHYDYPLYTEVKEYGDPLASRWTGLCDGWAMAAIQYAEPKPITLANPDGILIPFGSSDIKALMTFASEFDFDRETVEVGQACETENPTTPDEIASCNDINAGAMHLALTNMIGMKQLPFVTERKADTDIWNQPTFAYETSIGQAVPSAKPGVRSVPVHTVLHYTEDLDESHFEATLGTSSFHEGRIKMDYTLEINDADQIVGGSWNPGSDRPDYFWLPTNHLEFTGNFAGINRLLQP